MYITSTEKTPPPKQMHREVPLNSWLYIHKAEFPSILSITLKCLFGPLLCAGTRIFFLHTVYTYIIYYILCTGESRLDVQGNLRNANIGRYVLQEPATGELFFNCFFYGVVDSRGGLCQ